MGIDGVLRQSSTVNMSNVNNNAGSFLGGYAGIYDKYQGDLDEVRLYATALTDTQITQVMNQPIVVTTPTPTPTPGPTSTPIPTITPTPVPSIYWSANYYNNKTLSGTPALVRQDANLSFNWGSNSPATQITADNFSVRWVQTVNFPTSGNYHFTTKYNDGVRVYIDGSRKLNDWSSRTSTKTTNTTVNLSAGNHTLQVDYFENTANAELSFSWIKI